MDRPTIEITNLPYEVLTIIFAELSLQDLLNVTLSCKKFKEVVDDNNTIWRKKCDEMFLVAHATDHNGSSHNFVLSPYNQCRISSNWCKGFYRKTVIAQSKIKYIPWLSLQPECLILSTGSTLTCYPRDRRRLPSSDTTLWKVGVPKVRRKGVRTNDISRFVVKDNVIVCGNRDGCIAVYDVMDVESSSRHAAYRPVLRDHIRDCHNDGDVEVTSVDCIRQGDDDYCIISGSNDSNVIKFWKEGSQDDIDTCSFNCVRSIQTTIKGARCLLLNCWENRLAVGLRKNERPLLIDTEIGNVIYNPEPYSNHREYVRDIIWMDQHIVAYVTHSGHLICFDSRTESVVYNVFDPLATSLYSLKSDGRHAIVTGCSQLSRCVLFDVRSKRSYMQILFTQKCSSPVYSLDFDACALTAAAERGVAVLSFNISRSGVRQRDYASVVRKFT